MMNCWDQFAAEAERFEKWADTGIKNGNQGATEALMRITRLYMSGLELPFPDAGDGEVDQFRVTDEQWRVVFDRCAQLGIDQYNTCEPDLNPQPEYIVGSLCDDIADIYRDVLTGLRMYRAGQRQDAAWQWSFGFRAHWGTHAVDAIRVLHRSLYI